MEYPIVVEKDGIKIKPEEMTVDKMNHCIYDRKVYIFNKDQENLTHCYEVNDPLVVQKIINSPDNIKTYYQSSLSNSKFLSHCYNPPVKEQRYCAGLIVWF